MNKLKTLKTIHTLGYISLFIASIFSLVNTITEKRIFNEFVLFPLLIIGIAGIVTGFIYLTKLPTKEDEKEQNMEQNTKE